MHVVFANTGVQYVCQPLASGQRFTSASVGHGWQRCEVQEAANAVRAYHFIQWKIVPGKLLLAVETTCGDPEKGFFCNEEALAGDFPVVLEGLVGLEGAPLAGLPRVDLTIRPATAGAGVAKEVHVVVDFGNSRTGALLIEPDPEAADTPLMEPFELINRHHLDAWDENGEFQKKQSARWFSSRTQWCTSPYLPPPRLQKTLAASDDGGGRGGLFGRRRPIGTSRTVFVIPRLFQDLSAVRMGQEADDVTQVMQTDGTVLTGVSSPKRYLWADDDSWLQGAIWHMADPDDRLETRKYAATLQGPLLRYLDEEDPDDDSPNKPELPPLDSDEISDEEIAREIPYKPHHAPRCLMVAALYELLAQAYTYVNSVPYRSMTGEQGRPREIRNLTLTYPSGMITQERERFRRQAQKAIDLFRATLGRRQHNKPTLTLSIDEASAVHLTYLWSELQLVDRDPRLWFSLVGHDPAAPEPEPAEEPAEPPRPGPPGMGGPARPPGQMRPPGTMRPPGQLGPGRPGGPARPGSKPLSPSLDADNAPNREVRIACIDIGGGTSDLMIARYELSAGTVDTIAGEMLHRDGISHAGDQLVKRLLERIIVPYFSDRVGMQADERERLFGEERPWNRHFRAERILWINRLFVPLAQAYLQNAVDENPQTIISHTDPNYVDPDIVQSLQDRIDKEFKAGTISVFQELGLAYDQAVFEPVVHEVFNELLLDFCERIVHHDADIVLLAGQPTKLRYIQDLVQMYLPLHASRIVPMFNHYAGNWYPYQDAHGRNPGIIVDPKSAVVVGAAVESLMTKGKLGSIRFKMKDQHAAASPQTNLNRYHWGMMDERSSRIRGDRVLFSPENTTARFEFEMAAERILIGRRLSPDPRAEATPVWLLKVDKAGRDGPIDLKITLTRHQPKGQEEFLELVAVKGDVAGQPAEMAGPGQNVFFSWRTLADERYFLDTGALDNIDTY